MRTVQEIKDSIRQLSRAELAAFRSWFTEFDAQQWDRELEEDPASGKLDALVQEAITDLRQGRLTGDPP
jgi:hypothetical protein